MNYKEKFQLSNCIKVALLRNFEFLCLSKFSHGKLITEVESHKTLVKSTIVYRFTKQSRRNFHRRHDNAVTKGTEDEHPPLRRTQISREERGTG